MRQAFSFIIVIVIVGAFWLSLKQQHRPEASTGANIIITSDPISLPVFDRNLFEKNLAIAKKQTAEFPASGSLGLVVPHHDQVGYLIADAMENLAYQKPKTIFLLGPNHFERGTSKIITTDSAWNTPRGTVEPNLQIIEELIRLGLAGNDRETTGGDHSIYTALPYIEFYMPNTTVVPIMVSNEATREQFEALAAYLSKNISKSSPLVASIDFSHYLTSAEAQVKDSETIEIIRNRNLESLIKLNDSYLDAPVTMAIVIEALKQSDISVIHHTNLGQLTGNLESPTTSYYVLSFTTES